MKKFSVAVNLSAKFFTQGSINGREMFDFYSSLTVKPTGDNLTRIDMKNLDLELTFTQPEINQNQ